MRCLGDAALEAEVDAREVAQENTEDEELLSPYVVDDELDLGRWAHDAAVLAIPTQFLCRPDCAGLCPVCGESLNDADPADHEHESSRRSSLGQAQGAEAGVGGGWERVGCPSQNARQEPRLSVLGGAPDPSLDPLPCPDSWPSRRRELPARGAISGGLITKLARRGSIVARVATARGCRIGFARPAVLTPGVR